MKSISVYLYCVCLVIHEYSGYNKSWEAAWGMWQHAKVLFGAASHRKPDVGLVVVNISYNHHIFPNFEKP